MLPPTEEIKSRLDIVEFVGSYLKLQKAGINYKANCPFHGEKTPSFFVSPTRQMWHCFGCGKGGDIFKFIMELEGHDFPEALRMLADRAGVVIRREDPRVSSMRNRLYDVCAAAAELFSKNFQLTPAVKTYITKRGLNEETIKEFKIGFAPQSWDFLVKNLVEKGFKKDELVAAGLAIKSDDGSSVYDRFRNRIMFPITDSHGQTIGFGGRIFDEESRIKNSAFVKTTADRQESSKTEAKYINTPATMIYDKSQVLYGFDRAKGEIRTKNQVVVVEGYMDCVLSHQAGVKNTIAVSGTALTPQQLKVIKRLCDTMVSSFDTDVAGESATRRSLVLASEFEFERKIAVIPSGKDPADAVKENPEQWIAAVQDAKPVIDFYIEKAFGRFSPATSDGKKKIAEMVLPWIAELANEIEKSHWARELARRLGVEEQSIWKELKKNNSSVLYTTAPVGAVVKEAAPANRKQLLEDRLLTLLPLVAEETRRRELENHKIVFTAQNKETLFNALCGTTPVVADSALAKSLEMLKFQGEVIAGALTNIEEEFVLCRKELEKECIKEELNKLAEEIDKAEKGGNHVRTASLLDNFRDLSAKLRQVSSR